MRAATTSEGATLHSATMPSRRVLRLLCTLGIMCLLLTATAVEAGKKRRRQGKKKGRTSTKSTTRKKKRRTVSERACALTLHSTTCPATWRKTPHHPPAHAWHAGVAVELLPCVSEV